MVLQPPALPPLLPLLAQGGVSMLPKPGERKRSSAREVGGEQTSFYPLAMCMGAA